MRLSKQTIGQLLLAASFASATEDDINPSRYLQDFRCRPGEIEFDLELLTDRFPQDTSYVVTDIPADREVFRENGFEKNTRYERKECLACSTYKFEFLDTFGDGLLKDAMFSLFIDSIQVLSHRNGESQKKRFESLDVTFAGSGNDCTPVPNAIPTAAPTTPGPTVALSNRPTVAPSPYPTVTARPSGEADNCRDSELTVVVNLLTDRYPQDTSITVFNVTNSSDATTFYTAPQPLVREALNSFYFCAPCKDKYELNIKDAYGDGIYKPGNYNITVDGKNKGGGKVYNRGVTTPFSASCKITSPTLSPAPTYAPTTNEVGTCADNGDINFRLELMTDKWPEEISLTIVDSISGNIVKKVKSFEKETLTIIKECLPCSNYTLTVNDSANDGIEGDGLKLYVDKKLVKSTKVVGSETSVDFYKKCPRENDVYLKFSQDFKSPVALNTISKEKFEVAMEKFAEKLTTQYKDTECVLKCNVLSDEFYKATKKLSVEYALTCKTSNTEPDLYRLRFIEISEEEKATLNDLLKSAGITASKLPTYTGDFPPPTISPTDLPSSMPSFKPSHSPTSSTLKPSSSPSPKPSLAPSSKPTTVVAPPLLFHQEFTALGALNNEDMKIFEALMKEVGIYAANFTNDTRCADSVSAGIKTQVYTKKGKLIVDYSMICDTELPRDDLKIYRVLFPQAFRAQTSEFKDRFTPIGLTEILSDPIFIQK